MVEAKSSRIGARSLFLGAAAVVVLAGLKAAQSLVIPFLLALFLAIICAPAVTWLTRRRVPAGLAVLVVVIVLMALLTGFGVGLRPTISTRSLSISCRWFNPES